MENNSNEATSECKASRSDCGSVQYSTANSELANEQIKSEPYSLEDTQYLYAAQYFGFTPDAFCDGVYNGILSHTWDDLEFMQNIIHSEFPDLTCEESSTDIREKIFFPHMEETLKPIFDKFQEYVKLNILVVPKNALLREDKVHEIKGLSEEAVNKKINILKEKIMATKGANAIMEQSLKTMNTKIADLQKLVVELDELLECSESRVSERLGEMKKSYSQITSEDVQSSSFW